jgi:two-component system, OmpR family, phosphate regulon sensor histidine kinase PhoR
MPSQLLWFSLGIAVSILLLCGYWVSRIFIRIIPELRLGPNSIQKEKFKNSKRSRVRFPNRSKDFSESTANFFLNSLPNNFSSKFSENPPNQSFWGGTWQEILNFAPIGYLQVDAENRLFWCNQKLMELLNLSNLEFNASEPKLLLQLVRSYELDQLIEQTRQQEGSLQKEWIFRRVNPDPLFPVQSADLPLRGHSLWLENQHIGIFIESYAQEFLLTQQRDRWASDLAHELKTPLTSIRLLAETVYHKVETTERDWIERLLKEVLRLSNLVEDLLDLSKPDGGMTLSSSTFDLVAAIQNAWTSLEPLAARKKIKLVFEGVSKAEVKGDESRIYRLLLNLLDNAIKHSPTLQIILVKLSFSDRQLWQIEVIDSGEGFPEDSIPYIFERFYRVDRSRSRASNERGGSGLGLAIVEQIVKAHGGEIQICNHPETNGAWVKVLLP